MAKADVVADDWKWKVEGAAETLMQAEAIKRDVKLLTAARQELKKRAKEAEAAAKKI
jgi:hypothetical protein